MGPRYRCVRCRTRRTDQPLRAAAMGRPPAAHALGVADFVTMASHDGGLRNLSSADGAATRAAGVLDVMLTGTVFFDIVFTGLPHRPAPGREVWTEGMGSGPGGIANLAVATARLGLRTGLAAAFSEDLYGGWRGQVRGDRGQMALPASAPSPGWPPPCAAPEGMAGDR